MNKILNPKSEGRNPKESRRPKSDWENVLDDSGPDGSFWKWDDETDGIVALREDSAGKPPPPDLMERVAVFGETIVCFAKKIPRGFDHPENRRLIDQLVGAATSIGANYCEADDSVSGKDFQHKIGISRKESKETMFFLRMIAASAKKTWRTKRGSIGGKPG